jgi:hypothetical protein
MPLNEMSADQSRAAARNGNLRRRTRRREICVTPVEFRNDLCEKSSHARVNGP